MSQNGVPSSGPSDSRSVADRFRADVFKENGREYYGRYMLPCDEDELDRLDMLHHFFLVAREHKLMSDHVREHLPPAPRIVDAGCGTGIWAMDVADQFQTAEGAFVQGFDTAVIQPPAIPANARFNAIDIEAPWPNWYPGTWDLVHIRMLLGAIHDWDAVYREAFKYLKPGTGCIEHVEIDFVPRSDEGTLPRTSEFSKWAQDLMQAMETAGCPMNVDRPRIRGKLAAAGFEDIREEVIKIYCCPWRSDPHDKEIGKWFFLSQHQGVPNMSYAPFTRILRHSKAEVDAMVERVKRELGTLAFRAYCYLHIWTARKPRPAGQ